MVTISPKTKLYGLFGKPVAHSMGPYVHNSLMRQMGVDGVYLAFEIEDVKKAVDAIRTLDIKGVSVTIPHKVTIMAHLDEIDPMAQSIGAVNTVINKGGYLIGKNTDCEGAIIPLKEITEIGEKKVLIIGAGGAARAVAFGIAREKGNITIVNRDSAKGQNLSRQVGGAFLRWDAFEECQADFVDMDIIINCTAMGMSPHINDSPLHRDRFFPALTKKMGADPEKKDRPVVMDIVYNPLDTKLLQDAIKSGCHTVDGLSMFVYQGAEQFKLFTGQYPSVVSMRKLIEKRLKEK